MVLNVYELANSLTKIWKLPTKYKHQEQTREFAKIFRSNGMKYKKEVENLG